MNKKVPKKFTFHVGLGVIIALTCGAYLDFYPFLGDDLIVREIQFCTFIICLVVSICAVSIMKNKD